MRIITVLTTAGIGQVLPGITEDTIHQVTETTEMEDMTKNTIEGLHLIHFIQAVIQSHNSSLNVI